MANCRRCYATIQWTETRSGQRIPLDEHFETSTGPNRYRVIDHLQDGTPIVEPVPAESSTPAPVDHRAECQRPQSS